MAGVREACAAGEAAMRAVQAVRGEVAALQRQVVSVREVAVLKHSLEDEVTALRGEVAAVWEVAAMERSEVQRLTGKVADLKRDLAAVKAVLCSKEEDRSDMWHVSACLPVTSSSLTSYPAFSFPAFPLTLHSLLPCVLSYPAFSLALRSLLPCVPSFPAFPLTLRSLLPFVLSYPALPLTPRSLLPCVPSSPALSLTLRSLLPCFPSFPALSLTLRSLLPCVPPYPAFSLALRSLLPCVLFYSAFPLSLRSLLPCKILAASEETKLEPRNNQYATDAVLAHIYSLPSLTYLDLTGTRLGEENDRAISLEGIGAATGLQALVLDETMVRDTDLLHITLLTSLRTLSLNNGDCLTQASMLHVGRLTGLQDLCLGGCSKMGDNVLPLLAGLGHLSSISMPRGVTDAGLVESRCYLGHAEEGGDGASGVIVRDHRALCCTSSMPAEVTPWQANSDSLCSDGCTYVTDQGL
ncbi:unnamed protein product [Closterium sp. NIES-65]|nr:unnamed protein product [Closterium sp. NIES-65]